MSNYPVGSNMGHRDAEDFCREMPFHASEELKWLRERVQSLQRAEELLRETRRAYIKDGTLQARKIDAYFGGNHDGS